MTFQPLLKIPGLPLALFGWPGGWEIAVILLVSILLFGKRLPDIARGVGRSITEFKDGLKGVEKELSDIDAIAKKEVRDLQEATK